jgi:hypothetical protein
MPGWNHKAGAAFFLLAWSYSTHGQPSPVKASRPRAGDPLLSPS